MSNSGNVRPFAEQDRSDVVAIWRETFADDPPWNDPDNVIDTKLQVQPDLFLVYETAGRVRGTVIAGFDGFRGWIHHVAVHPSMQGEGIARQMIDMAETGLRKPGCRKINLQVRVGNDSAAASYKSMGFSEEKRISMGKLLIEDQNR